MKLKLKHVFWIFILLLFVASKNVYAAGSFSVSANKTSLNPGGTATVTIKTTNCAGKFNISSSNSAAVSVSSSSSWVDGTVTITATAKADGKATITITPVDVSDNELNDVTGSKSVTITVSTPTPTNTSTTTNTNNNKPATNTSSNTNKNTTTNTNSTASSKSNNAYLKNMIVSVEGLTPAFSKNIYSYSLKVGENVDKINVSASVENSRATYSVSGNNNLKSGENKVVVRVTAEDGSVKNYIINVLKSDDPVKSDATLSSIIVEGATFSPEFDPNVTEYDLGDVEIKKDKLNIYAYTTSDNAKIEIVGNENLKDGENKVVLKVTSENGNVTKEYILKFSKVGISSEDSALMIIEDDKEPQSGEGLLSKIKNVYNDMFKDKMAIIMLYFFVWFEFIQVVYLYEKLKKYEKGEETNNKETRRVKSKENIEEK